MAPAEPHPEIDAYLTALPAERRTALQRLRDLIHRAAPEATERFAYRIPIIRDQQDLVGFSAAKGHLSLHVMSTRIVADVLGRHPDLKGGGATLHFTESAPLPEDLVEEIVRARAEENAEWRRVRGK